MTSFFQFDCTPCCTHDKIFDTVKVDISVLHSEDKENLGSANRGGPVQQKSWPQEQEESARVEAERLRLEKLRKEAERRQEEERRLEEARLEEQRLERLKQERLEQERLELERLLEQERFEQERLEEAHRRAELARQEEETRAAEEERRAADELRETEKKAQEERERRAKADEVALAKFLKEHKYTGVNVKRTRMMKSKYPLHTAVKLQDTNMIRVLLEAKADPTLKSSYGETPAELAARLFKGSKKGRSVLQALEG